METNNGGIDPIAVAYNYMTDNNMADNTPKTQLAQFSSAGQGGRGADMQPPGKEGEGSVSKQQAQNGDTTKNEGWNIGNWTVNWKPIPDWAANVLGGVAGVTTGVLLEDTKDPDGPIVATRLRRISDKSIPVSVGIAAGKLAKDHVMYPSIEYNPPTADADRQRVEAERARIQAAMDQPEVYNPGYGR